ncbi:flagellar hook protein FlgE [Pararhodospirillum oryzae]|uniref:Flagellar hook protein FlgE n=1 Tax=Pararhodospirillum oryzae TaxID=478448 RepID=A0A512H4F4_9PROT|nr:flagellar hook protein FlgE [Pararhodospirillum oryzae]GEO80344.1 flagellar hook protein FlgE [Pararhodospirillum oryzae]
MGSLSSSLYTAVSALNAQSAAVSAISNNLANSETIGYKSTNASFYSLVTGASSQVNFTGAGVIANPSQSIATQGVIIGTENETDLAIDGNGFFVVTSDVDSDVFYYTRVGDFDTDDEGYLVNSNGYYIQGYSTNLSGEITGGTSAAALEPINLDAINGTAVATSNLAVKANLPVNAAVGDSVQASVEVFDSLGVAHTIDLTYTKTALNEWTMVPSEPLYSSDGLTQSGTLSTASAAGLVITFNGDGTLASTAPVDASMTSYSLDVTWNTGAQDSTIAYSAGTVGKANGLSQYSSSSGDVEIELDTISQDGVRYGAFQSATVTEDGLVYANFDNGVSYAIYQIPLATFQNPNGLEAASGNVYLPTVQSGSQTYVLPGTSGSGTIFAGSLESSTVDTADEFSKLITAQQAYSAATQIVESAQEMFDDLISAKR